MSNGTGRIYRRGDVWWVDYAFRGERYRESSGRNGRATRGRSSRSGWRRWGAGSLSAPVRSA